MTFSLWVHGKHTHKKTLLKFKNKVQNGTRRIGGILRKPPCILLPKCTKSYLDLGQEDGTPPPHLRQGQLVMFGHCCGSDFKGYVFC